MTADLPEVPAYFPRDVDAQPRGAPAPWASDRRPRPSSRARSTRLLPRARPSWTCGTGPPSARDTSPGSVNIGLDGQFASWAGTLLSPDRPLVIVADDEAGAAEAAMRLARVGIENVAGLPRRRHRRLGGRGRPVATLPQITVDELHARLEEARNSRSSTSARPASTRGATCRERAPAPRSAAARGGRPRPPSRPTAVICAGGYRSSAACSLLEAQGFDQLWNVVGGTAAWTQAGFDVARPA